MGEAQRDQQGAPPIKRGLFGASALVGSMTMVSRVLGLVRDVIVARVIGADALADAFFVAFKIPNFLRRLFAEGAFSQAFVPVLAEVRERGGHAAVKHLADRVAGALGSSLIMLTVLAVLGAPVLTAMFAPGFVGSGEKFAATTAMIRVTFPYLLFISLTGFAGAILNSFDRFAIPAFTPVWLNVCLIGAALVATPWFGEPVYALAWGVFAAGIVQLLFQLPFLAQLHLLPRPKIEWRDAGVRKILRLMAPAMFGVSVSQINLLLDTVIASFLPTGSVSWLYYSDRLAELPLGVFGVAAATVILPNLSRQHATRSPEQFGATLDWALRFIILIAVPASLALIILARPILATLFYDGSQITGRDIAMSSYSMSAYAAGVTAFMLIKVLAPGFYARQDMRTPVRIGIIAMVVNMVLNIALVIPLHHYWQVGHAGLALATSVAAVLNASLLYRGLRVVGVYRPCAGWGRFFAILIFANIAMASSLWVAVSSLPDWLVLSAGMRVVWLLALCGGGLLVYAAALYSAGMRIGELRNLPRAN